MIPCYYRLYMYIHLTQISFLGWQPSPTCQPSCQYHWHLYGDSEWRCFPNCGAAGHCQYFHGRLARKGCQWWWYNNALYSRSWIWYIYALKLWQIYSPSLCHTMQVQMDILFIVSNVQQVSPEELEASQEKTNSSARLHNMSYTVPVPAHIIIRLYYFPIIIVIII